MKKNKLREAMFECANALGVIPEQICVRPCLSGDGKFAAFVLEHNKDNSVVTNTVYGDDEVTAVNKLRRFTKVLE